MAHVRDLSLLDILPNILTKGYWPTEYLGPVLDKQAIKGIMFCILKHCSNCVHCDFYFTPQLIHPSYSVMKKLNFLFVNMTTLFSKVSPNMRNPGSAPGRGHFHWTYCFWLTRCLDEETFSAREMLSGPRPSFRWGGVPQENLIDTLRAEKVTSETRSKITSRGRNNAASGLWINNYGWIMHVCERIMISHIWVFFNLNLKNSSYTSN